MVRKSILDEKKDGNSRDMAKDLIFELGCEEIPAGFIKPALAALAASLKKGFSEGGLEYGQLRTLGTPRRLTVIVEGLEEKEPDRIVESRGPAIKAAYDKDGNPTRALEGFARGSGVKPKDLKIVKLEKGEYLYAVKEIKGRKTVEILPELLRGVVSSLSFPKAMRWADHEMTFARPLHWILAVYGGKAVCFNHGHIASGNATYGHRFIAKGAGKAVKIKTVNDYLNKLKDNLVIADIDERRAVILDGIAKEAEAAGGVVLEDKGLVEEVVNLVEYPVVIRGSFEEEYLALPAEIIINAMREHQRYFSVIDKAGKQSGKGYRLLPAFITVANTPVKDEAVVRAGNERVLRARLSDAKFYFDKDVSTPLADNVEALKGVVFQAKLGSSYEKVERFTRLALYIGRWLEWCDALEDSGGLEGYLKDKKSGGTGKKGHSHTLGRASMLAKADLVSGIVGEFPSLQGVMGEEFARRDGEAKEVAAAIGEHYLPISAGGELPETTAGAIISIADKLDTIAGCFGVGRIPTGAADPYALRRASLGIIRIILDKGWSIELDSLVAKAVNLVGDKLTKGADETEAAVLEFIRERFRNYLKGEGLQHDSIDAVLSTGWFDIADAVKRIRALEKFKEHPACESLVAAFKRVSNILKGQEVDGLPAPNIFEDGAERALFEVYSKIAPVIRKAEEKGDYAKVFEKLASIKDVIDKFFDDVMVMAEDEKLRRNRLILLGSIRELYSSVADLSKLVV
ncbi:Glycyl-tRNA synthetase beta chain [hydrothermal vent metagenome]|uniref:glycine--tRNA ligase n=1 Tax=hydrothermal vent metagenome TaxID=652676 RepID=A0A3B0QX26_9ZZZZ